MSYFLLTSYITIATWTEIINKSFRDYITLVCDLVRPKVPEKFSVS